MENELIESIKKDLELQDKISEDELYEKLRQHINHLIQHDFEKLVTLLYRIDVSEKKLKQLLQQQNEDSADIITKLIIERQLQKIRTRKEFNSGNNISEEEKW